MREQALPEEGGSTRASYVLLIGGAVRSVRYGTTPPLASHIVQRRTAASIDKHRSVATLTTMPTRIEQARPRIKTKRMNNPWYVYLYIQCRSRTQSSSRFIDKTNGTGSSDSPKGEEHPRHRFAEQEQYSGDKIQRNTSSHTTSRGKKAEYICRGNEYGGRGGKDMAAHRS